MTEKQLKPASASDRDAVIQTLTAAFLHDPVFDWVFPDEAEREVHLPRLFGINFDLVLPVARSLISADGQAASFWRPPGHAEASTLDYLMRPLQSLAAFGMRVLEVAALANAIKAHLPTKGPFWHVHFVGVTPDLQRNGWGTAMMCAGEDLVGDAAVYLETAKPENIKLYTGLGYETTGEWTIPGGPKMWSMLKSPG